MPSDVEQLKTILQNFPGQNFPGQNFPGQNFPGQNFPGQLSGGQISPSPYVGRFSEAEVDLLSKYYEIVLKWNNRLHLTTLTGPQEFFDRHILESFFSESLILPAVNQIWDIGSGLGVPGIIIAIARSDLEVHLVEAGRNKSLFLEEAAACLSLNQVNVIASRFEDVGRIPAGSCLTVRAIEGMEKLIPEILKSGAEATQILILGASSLAEKARVLLSDQRHIESLLIPGSDRRYVINIFRST